MTAYYITTYKQVKTFCLESKIKELPEEIFSKYRGPLRGWYYNCHPFDESKESNVKEVVFMKYLRAKYRRKIERGEVIDLDKLAFELKSVKDTCR